MNESHINNVAWKGVTSVATSLKKKTNKQTKKQKNKNKKMKGSKFVKKTYRQAFSWSDKD